VHTLVLLRARRCLAQPQLHACRDL
jgi:hypothetical protein